MKTISISVILCLYFTSLVFADPAYEIWYYDNGRVPDTFNDVFATQDGGYAVCGMIYYGDATEALIYKLSDNGQIEWRRFWESTSHFNSIIETDRGELLAGGDNSQGFFVVLLSGDGELIWQRNYGRGTCKSVIELKSGEFAYAGNTTFGKIVMADRDGEPIWELNCDNDPGGMSSVIESMRETEHGLLTVGRWTGANESHGWIQLTDFDGDKVWHRDVDAIRNGGRPRSISFTSVISTANGHYAIAGHSPYLQFQYQFVVYLTVIDLDGNIQFMEAYPTGYFIWDETYSITRIGEEGYAIAGNSRGYGEWNRYPFVMRISSDGEFLSINRFDEAVEAAFRENFITGIHEIITLPDNSLLAAGTMANPNNDDNTGLDGVLIFIEPEIMGPILFYYSPEDTTGLTIFQYDSLTFTVRARNQQGAEMNYRWFYDQHWLGTDTTETVVFNELGEHFVRCEVSSDAVTREIRWRVDVVDFMIVAHQPENLNLTIRRGTSQDFAIEAVSIIDIPIEYEWTIRELPHGREEVISDQPSVLCQFDLVRDYEITGYAWRERMMHSRTWRVSVKSVIYDYWPKDAEIAIDTGRYLAFGVEPFDPGSESLRLEWYVNDELISNSVEVDLSFPEVGEYSVVLYALDGEESDTLMWRVIARAPAYVGANGVSPIALALHPAHPNPFNRQTTLRFDLPHLDIVRLSIFDTQGRLVKTLLNEVRPAGSYFIDWDASDFSAGVYLIRLETASGLRSVGKVVLMP